MKSGSRLIVQNWSCAEGCEVDVVHDDAVIRTGFVELAAPSGDYVWLAAEGNDRRELFDRRDGYVLLTDEDQAYRIKILPSAQ